MIISQGFGNLMTPLSRVQMNLKLTNASSRVVIIYIAEVATQILWHGKNLFACSNLMLIA